MSVDRTETNTRLKITGVAAFRVKRCALDAVCRAFATDYAGDFRDTTDQTTMTRYDREIPEKVHR